MGRTGQEVNNDKIWIWENRRNKIYKDDLFKFPGAAAAATINGRVECAKSLRPGGNLHISSAKKTVFASLGANHPRLLVQRRYEKLREDLRISLYYCGSHSSEVRSMKISLLDPAYKLQHTKFNSDELKIILLWTNLLHSQRSESDPPLPSWRPGSRVSRWVRSNPRRMCHIQ